MQDSVALPSHSRFDQALDSIGLDHSASEIHGVLCGLVCAGTSQAHVEWMEELFRDRPVDDLLAREARQTLGQLYLASRQQMTDEGLEFSLLLPDDETRLEQRAGALVQWCEGFLFGLGMGGVTERQLAGDAQEALHDISEFTRLDVEALEEGESDETAYMELQEFLRVATLLIREELASMQESSDGGE
jgi:uncharacterized protein YgfB (UPF0149 family)